MLLLVGNGGVRPEVVQRHAIEFTFENEDAWWAWTWSHASRVFLEALSEESVQRFRQNAYDAMQPLRAEAGFARRFTAIFSRSYHDARNR